MKLDFQSKRVFDFQGDGLAAVFSRFVIAGWIRGHIISGFGKSARPAPGTHCREFAGPAFAFESFAVPQLLHERSVFPEVFEGSGFEVAHRLFDEGAGGQVAFR